MIAMAKRNSALGAMEPVALDEMLSEGLEPWRNHLDELRRAEPGSREYRDALCRLWTLAEIIGIKAKIASDAIDEYLDVLPDGD
jgi:hypothetical protein